MREERTPPTHTIFSDLLFRIGADKNSLLAEDQLKTAEKILHSAALLEHTHINWQEHIQQVSKILPHSSSISANAELVDYLQGGLKPQKQGLELGTKFPSLNRADSYLLSLTTLDVNSFENSVFIDAL